MSENIIIVGGGLSGLALAYYLKERTHHVTVLEAANRTGSGKSQFHIRRTAILSFRNLILTEDCFFAVVKPPHQARVTWREL